MIMRCLFNLRLLFTFGVLAVLVSGCGSFENKAQWEQRVSATARITEINHDTRRMVVRVGLHKMTLKVSESLTSFPDRRVGDRLRVDYLKAVVVAVVPTGTEKTTGISRFHLTAPEAERPGVAYVRKRQFAANFIDIDYQSGLATFQLDDGSNPQVLVPNKLRPFVRTMSLEDRVLVSVEQAIAISVVPVD